MTFHNLFFHVLSYIIFCEVRSESISQHEVEAAYKYDREFQPHAISSYGINNNEIGGKRVSSIW